MNLQSPNGSQYINVSRV